MKKSSLIGILLGLILSIFFSVNVKAEDTDIAKASEIEATITTSNGGSIANMTDNSYNTRKTFAKSDTINITSSKYIYGIYIKWDTVPGEWTLTYNDQTVTYGKNGYLHEYVSLPGGSNNLTITLGSDEAICNLSCYSNGVLPSDVQVWDEPLDNKTDVLVFATHADDEALFLGGVLATYAGQEKLNVQVAYMCEFTSTAKIREHEKLDGIWVMGVRNYPVCGDFKDLYSESLEAAKKQYSYDKLKEYVAECMRRFKPLVVVSQDFKGEYGHGGHMIYAAAIADCLTISNDSTQFPESASKYGTWDVPKAYFHLYEQNKIKMNLRVPLTNMSNKTALEVAKEGYKQHVSQQWCWFYVDDEYEYSCADFGLYRTTVGNDTGNDMLENITTYKEKEEQERLEKESLEQASIEAESASIEASVKAEKEAEKVSDKKSSFKAVIIVLAVILIILIVCLILRYVQVQKARKKRAAIKRKRSSR